MLFLGSLPLVLLGGFFLVGLSPHTKQSPHLHLPPEQPCVVRGDAVAGSHCLSGSFPGTATRLSESQCRGRNCALIVAHWTAPIACAVGLHIKCTCSLLPSPPHAPACPPFLAYSCWARPVSGTCALCNSSSRPGKGAGSWNAHTISNPTTYYRCC